MSAAPLSRPACAWFGAAIVSLTGCGAGSGGGGDTVVAMADGTPPAVAPSQGSGALGSVRSDPCRSSFYENLVGAWKGTVDYDRTVDGGSACTWSVAMEIVTEYDGVDSCTVRAVSESSVVHTVVADGASAFAEQCLDGTSRIELLVPFRARDTPVPGVDFDYPVRVGWLDRLEPGRAPGPYFGDAAVVRPYIELFDGIEPVASGDRGLEVSPVRIGYVHRFRATGASRFDGVLVRPEPDER